MMHTGGWGGIQTRPLQLNFQNTFIKNLFDPFLFKLPNIYYTP